MELPLYIVGNMVEMFMTLDGSQYGQVNIQEAACLNEYPRSNPFLLSIIEVPLFSG